MSAVVTEQEKYEKLFRFASLTAAGGFNSRKYLYAALKYSVVLFTSAISVLKLASKRNLVNWFSSFVINFLDLVFKNTYRGKYEGNVNKAKSVNDMVSVLIDGDKTLADLAAKIDEDYNF